MGLLLTENQPGQNSTLKEVWESMQRNHFPILATSTKDIWHRRYKLLQPLEHLSMEKITKAQEVAMQEGAILIAS